MTLAGAGPGTTVAFSDHRFGPGRLGVRERLHVPFLSSDRTT